MTDNLSKKQRSFTMSRIRSTWTTIEKKTHGFLKAKKIKHKMHPLIECKPDLVIPSKKTAVFINGCFWHKCPVCYIKPKTNTKYWLPKIEANVKRDKKNIKLLRKAGWKVVVLWEHEIKKNFKKAVGRLL